MTVTAHTFNDGYDDRPKTERAKLSFEIGRLSALHWADPGDRELKEALERAEEALRAFDRAHAANGGGA